MATSPKSSRVRLLTTVGLVLVVVLLGAPKWGDERLFVTAVGWTRAAWLMTFGETLEITLHYPRPEARTRWRVPEGYLAQDYNYRELPTALIAIDAVLPDMNQWRTSGLSIDRDDHILRKISITVEAGEDFTREKRILPKLQEIDFEFLGEYDDLLKYREIIRGKRSGISVSSFFLVPKHQIPGRAVYFVCEHRCTAYADFSKTVMMEVRFAKELLGDWPNIDRKARGLLEKFIIP